MRRSSRPAELEKVVFGLAAALLLVLVFFVGQRFLESRGGAAAPVAPGGRTVSVDTLPPGATGTESSVDGLAPIRGSGRIKVVRRASAPPPPAK